MFQKRQETIQRGKSICVDDNPGCWGEREKQTTGGVNIESKRGGGKAIEEEGGLF